MKNDVLQERFDMQMTFYVLLNFDVFLGGHLGFLKTLNDTSLFFNLL